MIIWRIPKDLLATSIKIMRPHGVAGNEGLALWLGKQIDDKSVAISHVVEVFGAGFTTSPLYLTLSSSAISSLTDLAESLDAYLVGQVHSHPGLFLELSDLDKSQGIRIDNYLSVVCPHYARRDATTLSECGIHVFEAGSYRRLGTREISMRLVRDAQTVVHVRQEVRDD